MTAPAWHIARSAGSPALESVTHPLEHHLPGAGPHPSPPESQGSPQPRELGCRGRASPKRQAPRRPKASAKNARRRPCQAGDQQRASHQGILPRQLAPQVFGSPAAQDLTHRAPHVQAAARQALPRSPPSLGPPGGRGGNLLAAGSDRLQTRFWHLNTVSWVWLYRFDAGPRPEDHLHRFMSARLRSQLAPGPAPKSLPPANWLASSASDGNPTCPGHRRARLHPPGPFAPRSVTPACPASHHRHAPKSLPPANWLASSASDGNPPAACACVWPPTLRRIDQVPLDAQLVALPSRSSHQGSPWCLGAIPLYRPGAAGLANGGVFTNRAKDRADAQRLVATRLLDRLHDPLGHISRLQRIHPRAR
ncbi:hypothetical protein APUU_60938A [Aspergillus puulaauensis]|uniref:Uncharacterized protein n=1 Tax=Aspergillus puulaauensis TaxID=1220207 RepID=A0A7R7XUE1_9EURO|nr:hypothetical protein APUU_60934A [Aspergillus puulaauensis]BCS27888.1 hypothetical protein APUU_60936A [Aspergillus puulaauensis]BCS27890.1 hypothetical protein APUU_60938A [Aspergillus puulaauensis]